MHAAPATFPGHPSPARSKAPDMAERLPGGVDKVKRYGWKFQDQPGQMRLIDKRLLRVDFSYQRPVKSESVEKITRNYSFVAAGAIIVSERGGFLWVIDGQHRHAAAMRRSDILELPCLVFQMASVEDEARAFLAIQLFRRPMGSLARQNALVTAGDPAAVLVEDTLNLLGLVKNNTPRLSSHIKCIGWCQERAASNAEAFRIVLRVGADLHREASTPISEKLLESLWFLHLRCGEGLNDRRLVKRLHEKGARVLLDAAQRAAALYAAGGGAIWAQGVLTELNKGLRQKFVMRGSVEKVDGESE